MNVLNRLDINHSTWGYVGLNSLIYLLIDLVWEEFAFGSFQASWEHLQLDIIFQLGFYI